MNKKSVTMVGTLLITSMLVTGCETLGKLTWGRTGTSTAIGCGAGLALGAIYDEVQRKKENKDRRQVQNAVLGIFKERKKHNQGKIVGLATGCLAGLGVGVYLDIMYDDMNEQFGTRGLELEKVKGRDGETDELLVKMAGDITFDTGSASLQGTGKENVELVAEALEGYPETAVKIGGHTDSTGSLAVNQPLSERRAQSVASELKSEGVSSSRIAEVKGYADQYPVVRTSGAERQNRRVEVRIVAE